MSWGHAQHLPLQMEALEGKVHRLPIHPPAKRHGWQHALQNAMVLIFHLELREEDHTLSFFFFLRLITISCTEKRLNKGISGPVQVISDGA